MRTSRPKISSPEYTVSILNVDGLHGHFTSGASACKARMGMTLHYPGLPGVVILTSEDIEKYEDFFIMLRARVPLGRPPLPIISNSPTSAQIQDNANGNRRSPLGSSAGYNERNRQTHEKWMEFLRSPYKTKSLMRHFLSPFLSLSSSIMHIGGRRPQRHVTMGIKGHSAFASSHDDVIVVAFHKCHLRRREFEDYILYSVSITCSPVHQLYLVVE